MKFHNVFLPGGKNHIALGRGDVLRNLVLHAAAVGYAVAQETGQAAVFRLYVVDDSHRHGNARRRNHHHRRIRCAIEQIHSRCRHTGLQAHIAIGFILHDEGVQICRLLAQVGGRRNTLHPIGAPVIDRHQLSLQFAGTGDIIPDGTVRRVAVQV